MMIVVKGMSGNSEIGYRVRQDQPLRLLAKHFAIKQGRPDAAIVFKHQDRTLRDYAATLKQLGLADGDVLEAGFVEEPEAASGATLENSQDNATAKSMPGLPAPVDHTPLVRPAKRPRAGPAELSSSQNEAVRQGAPGEPQEQAAQLTNTADSIARGGSTALELCGVEDLQRIAGSAPGASIDGQPVSKQAVAAQQDVLPGLEGPGEERVRALHGEHSYLAAAKARLSSQLRGLKADLAVLASRRAAAAEARAAFEAVLDKLEQKILHQGQAEAADRAALQEHGAAMEEQEEVRQRLQQELREVLVDLKAQRQRNEAARQEIDALQAKVDARELLAAAAQYRLGTVRGHDLGLLRAHLAACKAGGTLPQAQGAST
ncbi:hypothetical protein N2152v2_007128 [Parachlorella kessleri]